MLKELKKLKHVKHPDERYVLKHRGHDKYTFQNNQK